MAAAQNHTTPSVALVYDRVNTRYGGAENVILALNKIFPQAPLYTSVVDKSRADWAKKLDVRSSFLSKIPASAHLHRWLAPLMPLAFESLDLAQFDIVISITSAEAKGVLTQPNQLHVCYLLTPPRYLYTHHHQYIQAKSIFRLPLVKQLTKPLFNYLTWWDQAAIYRPDYIIPISQTVSQRVTDIYQLEPSSVIYPPVECPPRSVKPNNEQQNDFFLIVSRLVPYKRLDLAIKACLKSGDSLVIVGHGPERKKLIRLAKKNPRITFLGLASPQKLSKLYNTCTALLMPGEEDFGITALEANAHGKPVVINHKSGAAELITDGEQGIHLAQTTIKDMMSCMNQVKQLKVTSKNLIRHAHNYDTTSFINNFQSIITQLWKKHKELQHAR